MAFCGKRDVRATYATLPPQLGRFLLAILVQANFEVGHLRSAGRYSLSILRIKPSPVKILIENNDIVTRKGLLGEASIILIPNLSNCDSLTIPKSVLL